MLELRVAGLVVQVLFGFLVAAFHCPIRQVEPCPTRRLSGQPSFRGGGHHPPGQTGRIPPAGVPTTREGSAGQYCKHDGDRLGDHHDSVTAEAWLATEALRSTPRPTTKPGCRRRTAPPAKESCGVVGRRCGTTWKHQPSGSTLADGGVPPRGSTRSRGCVSSCFAWRTWVFAIPRRCSR